MNPDKLNLLLSDKKSHQVDICNERLSTTYSEKLLGIKIDNKLTFEEHVEELCKKASQNSVARISYLMRFEQRKSIVNLFIIFHLSYCTLVWMFHSRRLNNRIDHIHERALRTIYQGYTVIPLLTNYLRWISTCLILEKKFVEKSFQFPLLIHNQLNSLSAEDKMNDIEDTILLLWLFRKRRKSCRLMEKKRLKNSGSDLFLTREN